MKRLPGFAMAAQLVAVLLFSPACIFGGEGDPPDPPVLSVPSPGNVNDPAVRVVGAPGSIVLFFLSEDCSGEPLEAEIPSEGEVVIRGQEVEDNTISAYTALLIDTDGNASDCSEPVYYEHDNIPPEAPVLLETAPQSPNPEARPWVLGKSPGNPEGRIFLYASASHPDYACEDSIQGSFRGTGPVSREGEPVEDDFIVRIDPPFPWGYTYYIGARALDPAGNMSECSVHKLQYRVSNP